ncbi:hypothetical protein [Lysobacter gummosus]|uniref:hypothetical protein n=1 Tax=Lysobacter gummosus TaxID=262324 RepID=UPI0036350010
MPGLTGRLRRRARPHPALRATFSRAPKEVTLGGKREKGKQPALAPSPVRGRGLG